MNLNYFMCMPRLALFFLKSVVYEEKQTIIDLFYQDAECWDGSAIKECLITNQRDKRFCGIIFR